MMDSDGDDRRRSMAPRPIFCMTALTLCESRSEEHTSALQSPCNLVCRLLLEKKKKDHHVHSMMITDNSTQTQTVTAVDYVVDSLQLVGDHCAGCRVELHANELSTSARSALL